MPREPPSELALQRETLTHVSVITGGAGKAARMGPPRRAEGKVEVAGHRRGWGRSRRGWLALCEGIEAGGEEPREQHRPWQSG